MRDVLLFISLQLMLASASLYEQAAQVVHPKPARFYAFLHVKSSCQEEAALLQV